MSTIKLPRLTIPKFNGKLREWKQFCDMYTKLIHEDSRLHAIEKFTYLRTFIEGEPAMMISHFEVTAATYELAWNMLKSRFNNIRALVDAEIDFLLDFSRNVSVRELHDYTREALSNLKDYGVDTKTWDPILVRVITRRMDRDTLDLFEDTLDDSRTTPSLEVVLKFLEKRIYKLEIIKSLKSSK